MKDKFLIFFIFLFTISINSFSQKDASNFVLLNQYPSFEAIAEHFLKYHNAPIWQNNSFYKFRFARKPSGWYVYPEYYLAENENPVEIPIWTVEKSYILNPEDFTRPGEISLPGQLPVILNNTDRYLFSICPFYGYKGWDEDVLKYYKKADYSILSDNELYGLSKAYSSKASGVFWAHSQYSDDELVKAPFENKKDIRNYIKLSSKSVTKLDQLYKRNPAYKTMVGLMDVKLTNEILSHWYELSLFGHKAAAAKFLNKFSPEYDKYWAEIGSYILQNLEANAILITNGDNDTYPLLWHQQKHSLRKDVLIINSSLLKDSHYFSMISNGLFEAPPIQTGLSKKELDLLKNKTFYVRNDTALESIQHRDTEDLIRNNLSSEESIIEIDFGYNEIMVQNSSLTQDTFIMLNASQKTVSKNQFFLCSLINYELNNRPIYFIKPMLPEFQLLFNPKNLIDEGLVIRLSKKNQNNLPYNYSYYDPIKIQSLLNSSLVTLPDKKYSARIKWFQLFLEMESKSISENEEYTKDEKIGAILNFLKKYPPHLSGVSLHYFNMIYSLYSIESENKLADIFSKAFVTELENQVRMMELRDEDPDDYQNLRYLNYVSGSIIRSKLFEDKPVLLDRLYTINKSINKKLRQMPVIQKE